METDIFADRSDRPMLYSLVPYVLTFLFLVASVLPGLSEEAGDYRLRVQKHIARILHDPAMHESSIRSESGIVVVQVRIGANGKIRDATIVNSSASAQFGRSVVRALKRLRPIRNVQQPDEFMRFPIRVSR